MEISQERKDQIIKASSTIVARIVSQTVNNFNAEKIAEISVESAKNLFMVLMAAYITGYRDAEDKE